VPKFAQPGGDPSRRARRLGVVAALWLGFAGTAAAVQAPDTLAERTRPCTACHGKEGRATREGFFPRIAGKPAGYLYNQLVNFREARRANPAMVYLVQHMSDAYMQEIAQYFGSLDLPYPPPAKPRGAPDMARGEALALHGDPARKLPACVECHGQTLTGVLPAIPGVLGLPQDYLVGEFGAWRTGQRRAASPDCMAEIAQRMSAEDVSAVSAWLATRPLPPSAKPAASIAQPLPMRCGSGLEPAPR
jgi:cytochrome c553